MASKKVSVQISKPLVKGVCFSFLAMILFGIILNWIIYRLPFTPEHKEQNFLDINHQNPIVYGTNLMQRLMVQAGSIDAWIATLIVFTGCGAVFASCLPPSTWPMKRIVISSMIWGFVLSAILLTGTLLMVQAAQSLNHSVVSQLDPSALPVAAIQSLINASVFTLGAIVVALTRKKKNDSTSDTTNLRKQPA